MGDFGTAFVTVNVNIGWLCDVSSEPVTTVELLKMFPSCMEITGS